MFVPWAPLDTNGLGARGRSLSEPQSQGPQLAFVRALQWAPSRRWRSDRVRLLLLAEEEAFTDASAAQPARLQGLPSVATTQETGLEHVVFRKARPSLTLLAEAHSRDVLDLRRKALLVFAVWLRVVLRAPLLGIILTDLEHLNEALENVGRVLYGSSPCRRSYLWELCGGVASNTTGRLKTWSSLEVTFSSHHVAFPEILLWADAGILCDLPLRGGLGRQTDTTRRDATQHDTRPATQHNTKQYRHTTSTSTCPSPAPIQAHFIPSGMRLTK